MNPNDLLPMGGRPFRRIVRLFLGRDRDTGQAVPRVTGAEAYTMSPDGSSDSVQYQVPQVYDCGHTVEDRFGGQCFEEGCGALSCESCHGTCAACLKPICPSTAAVMPSVAHACVGDAMVCSPAPTFDAGSSVP